MSAGTVYITGSYSIFHARMEAYFQKYKEFAFKLILNG